MQTDALLSDFYASKFLQSILQKFLQSILQKFLQSILSYKYTTKYFFNLGILGLSWKSPETGKLIYENNQCKT